MTSIEKWIFHADEYQQSAIKRPSQPSALRVAILGHGVHPSAKACRWIPPVRKSAQKLKAIIQGYH
jgi:hypothetical protein